MNRREFIASGAAATAAIAAPSIATAGLGVQKVRMGFIGIGSA